MSDKTKTAIVNATQIAARNAIHDALWINRNGIRYDVWYETWNVARNATWFVSCNTVGVLIQREIKNVR